MPHEEEKKLPHEEKKELPQKEQKLITHEEHALLQEQHAALEDQLKRLQAEFENFRKRTEKERRAMADDGKVELLSALLPVLDDIEEARKHVKDGGILLIFSNMEKALSSAGLERIRTNGKFDPAFHEVAGTEEAGGEEGEITRTVSAGYSLHGRVLRPAFVFISRKK